MRVINPINLAQAQSEVPWVVDFVKITFNEDGTADSVLRVCNHHHDIVVTEVINNVNTDFTYVAAAQFLGFGDISDELEIKNNSLDLSLSGVRGDFTAIFVQSNVEGSLVEVSRGYYTESTFDFTYTEDFGTITSGTVVTINGGDIVTTPEPRWAGRVNNASIQDDYNYTDEDKIIISVSCKSLFETLFKRQGGRYTSNSEFSLRGVCTGGTAAGNDVEKGVCLAGLGTFVPDKSMEYMSSIALFTPSFGKED